MERIPHVVILDEPGRIGAEVAMMQLQMAKDYPAAIITVEERENNMMPLLKVQARAIPPLPMNILAAGVDTRNRGSNFTKPKKRRKKK